MNRILTFTPLMALPIAIYHAIVFASAGGAQDALTAPLFSLPMISGQRWTFLLGDAVLALGVGALFVEIVKATSTKTGSLVNHALSTGLLIFCLIEFLILRSFATSVFFLLMLMTLLDVLAGFMVTIVSARRDFGVGDHFSN